MDPEVNFAQESERVNTEGEAATFSKEDEFLRHLSQEEKECLSFLIETIDSLEVELEEDDEEGVTKGDSTISDGFYEFLEMVCSTRQTEGTVGPDDAGSCDNVGTIRNVDTFTSSPPAEMITNRGTESVPGLYTTPNQTAASEEGMEEKEPTKHQGSDTTITLESNTSNQSRETSPDEQRSPRTLTLLPAHAKKFDTILRSGVSVQELRAQVLARLNGSGQRPSSQVAGLAAQPNSLRLLGGPEQKAARQEALQRLGLWKFTGGLSNINSSSSQTLAMEGAQHSKSPQSPTEKDHEEALKKLGLLNL